MRPQSSLLTFLTLSTTTFANDASFSTWTDMGCSSNIKDYQVPRGECRSLAGHSLKLWWLSDPNCYGKYLCPLFFHYSLRTREKEACNGFPDFSCDVVKVYAGTDCNGRPTDWFQNTERHNCWDVAVYASYKVIC
ncbi:Endothelin-converting enzyme 1 [Venturia inaequalis]|nr:Endothelin-converting enzyme 1 [Venturia inaequalis]